MIDRRVTGHGKHGSTHTRFVSLFGRETFYFKHFANKVEESFVYLINKYEFILTCTRLQVSRTQNRKRGPMIMNAISKMAALVNLTSTAGK